MVSVEPLTDAAVSLISQYGYVALFLFILLETAWIIHFVPSEIVIPLVAIHIVTDPFSFAVFVTIMTTGAVLGSLVAYYLFGYYGEYVIQRYGHILRIPESEIERSKRWFRSYGEGFLLWGRLLPVLRTPISIPAGYAGTSLRTFIPYSAAGWLCYNAALVGLVYSGEDSRSPLSVALEYAKPLYAGPVSFVQSYPSIGALGLVIVAGVSVIAWKHRDAVAQAFE